MKWSVLIFLAFLAFVFSEAKGQRVVTAKNEVERMYEALASMFSIKTTEVETCIRKFGVIPDELENVANELFENGGHAQPDSLRRATCALTCCAQTKGMMIGAKINLPEIRKLMIMDDEMPIEAKKVHMKAVNECGELVKNMTDACDVGLTFVRCIVAKIKNSSEYK